MTDRERAVAFVAAHVRDGRPISEIEFAVEAEFAAISAPLEARIATLESALRDAESILSDGDYGEDVEWRDARNAARDALYGAAIRAGGERAKSE